MSPLSSRSSHLAPVARSEPPRKNVVGLLVRLGRPKYLLYSWILYTLGVVAAAYRGYPASLGTYLHGLLFVWCMHLMTHYCNEYFDLEADAANPAPTRWTGGSRVLVEGLLEPRVSLATSFVLLFVCLALVPAMPERGQYLAIAGLALSWFYTAPPFQLNYRGLGELVVTTGLNGCIPMIGYVLVTGTLGELPGLLLLPAFIIQFVRMMIMNLLDYEGDRRVGKRTLAVLLGPRRILHIHALGQLLGYLLLVPAVLWWGLPLSVALCVAATTPLAVWQVIRLYRGVHLDARTSNSVVFWASSHISLVVATAYAGLLLEGLLQAVFFQPGSLSRLFPLPLLFYGVILLRQMWMNRARRPKVVPA
jgi:1,4-dihydroxy-2-naphthoate octaprenyltransferase